MILIRLLHRITSCRNTGASPRCQEDEWLHAPAIQVRESAKNPSRHGVKIIARVPVQTTSRERSGRCKCTNDVHMPRKTGEEQLLHLAVPTLRQRNCESSSAVPGWTNTHCVLSFSRKGSSPKDAGSVKLINVLKLDVAQVSVTRRKCVLQCSDGSTTPGCDATHSLQARRQTRRRATANCDSPLQRCVDATRNRPHCKECGRLLQTLQKGKSAVSMRSSEAAEHFFVTVNQLQKKKCKMTRVCGDGHNYCMFFVREKDVSLVLFLPTTHEVGTASAAQVDR